jgi:signal transduction histidine kinase
VNDRIQLRPYDPASRTFAERPLAERPPSLEGVLPQLERTMLPPMRAAAATINGARFVTLAIAPVAADGAALLIPVLGSALANGPAPGGVAPPPQAPKFLEPIRAFVVVELDRAYIRRTMLPALVAKHFPEGGSDAYRVAVLQAAGEPLFARGFAQGTAIDPGRSDVSLPLFAIRVDLARDRVDLARDLLPNGDALFRASPAAPPAAGTEGPGTRSQISVIVEQRGPVWAPNRGGPGAFGSVVRVAGSGWRIVLQHASGSLDAAVARARRRNLALSFSILAILVAGVTLVVVNARRAQNLAAKQVGFVATVTHELRTPLAVIRSAAQNLSAGVVSEPAQAKRYGELIDNEGRRLTDTVEQVLAYAGLEGGRAPRSSQPIDIARLVAEVLESSQPMFDEAGFAVEADPAAAAALPLVSGDEAGLRLAVQNLVSNAVKHGAEGRWIAVTTEAAVHRGRPEVRVSVRDRGRGVDGADIGHVFEPFYRGRRALEAQVRGNGLGLSLVKRIVEAHGGRVTVKSAQGAGSVFVVCLPAGDAPEARAAQAEA